MSELVWPDETCPACDSTGTVFITPGGDRTCSWIECPDPLLCNEPEDAKSYIGKRQTIFEHMVWVGENVSVADVKHWVREGVKP